MWRILVWCNLLIFLISCYVFLGKGKILLDLMSMFCLCFLVDFIVSGLTFSCLIHCEFYVVYDSGSSLLLFFLASKICWRDYPLSIICSLLCHKLWPYTNGFNSGLSILFHWSMIFFFSFLPVPCCFYYYGFAVVWNQGVG